MCKIPKYEGRTPHGNGWRPKAHKLAVEGSHQDTRHLMLRAELDTEAPLVGYGQPQITPSRLTSCVRCLNLPHDHIANALPTDAVGASKVRKRGETTGFAPSAKRVRVEPKDNQRMDHKRPRYPQAYMPSGMLMRSHEIETL